MSISSIEIKITMTYLSPHLGPNSWFPSLSVGLVAEFSPKRRKSDVAIESPSLGIYMATVLEKPNSFVTCG